MVVPVPRFFRLLAAEIRRREVLRVVAIYAVSAWVVLQVVETTAEPLGLPPWTMRALVIATIVGFPISFFLAWVIDFRGDGFIFDLPLWVGEGDHSRLHKKSDVAYMALLALMLAGGIYGAIVLFLDDVADTQEVVASGIAPRNSIAVLAFENFDGNPETDYFAAGLAEEILHFLADLKELSVAARTSSFRFRGEQVDIREVGALLAVRHVLEGSVRRAGERVRVVAQLINAENGYHVWSKDYDRELTDIFAIQQEIASAVVNELKIALSVESEERLQAQPTESLDAYVLFLQGRDRMRSSNDADVMEAASGLFTKALEIDPRFARAHAGLCEARLRLYEISKDPTDFEHAESECVEAGRLDPGLSSEIRIALGKLYRFRGWYDRAEALLDEAIALSPEAVDAYIELGEVRAAQNRPAEAEALFQRAIDLKRNYWAAHEALASFLYRNERYREAAEVYEIVTNLAPDVASAFGGKGAALWMLGERDRARTAYDRSLALKPSRQGYTNMGMRYYYAGRFEDAVDMQKKALEFAPDDHRVWGRLAESYRFAAGGVSESRDAYRKAAELAAANLEVNESEWDTMGLLALYHAHLDRPEEALRLADRAVEISGRKAEALYYQALARQRTGDEEGALDALAEAVATDDGYRQLIGSDPDLAPLRDSPRFAQLLPEDG